MAKSSAWPGICELQCTKGGCCRLQYFSFVSLPSIRTAHGGRYVNGSQLGFLVMAIAAPTEYWRGQGGFGWDKGTTDQSYPGFDPLKLTNDRNKTAEIKNGRLAMAGILGLEAQRALTHQSPLAALAAHLANPLGANIITSHTNALAMF